MSEGARIPVFREGKGVMAPQIYRKRPIEILALQWTGENLRDMMEFAGPENFIAIHPVDRVEDPDATAELFVAANSRWLPIATGEWVAKDSLGFYPIKDAVFRESYEHVKGRASSD